MHRLAAETGQEPQAHQVQQAVHEAVHAEFGLAVLAFLVMDRFFADPAEAGVLGQIRDIAVHLTVHFDVFHHLGPVGLEAAVHVVQADAGDLAGGPVVQLGGDVLGEGVVLAVLFPARHQVVAFLADHPHHFGDFFRGVLKVGVHGDHDVPLRGGEAFIQGGRFPVIAAETDAPDGSAGLGGQVLNHVPGVVR